MRSVKIVSDTSCDLFELNGTPFDCAPMKIITEQKEFIDDTALNVYEMVEFLDKYKGRSKSSCPKIGIHACAYTFRYFLNNSVLIIFFRPSFQ